MLFKSDRPDKSDWKTTLRDPRAIGWIAFLILMISIGVGAVVFGGDRTPRDRLTRTVTASPSSQK
jgi:hypothetical protein